ncbi:MAG: hypothetical protein ACK5B9_05370 [Flavobacteriia bacterium]|jgi:hypothetical protein
MYQETKSPIVQGYEEQRQKLLSFKKYLEYQTRDKTVTKINVEFENKRFGTKGFATISSPPEDKFLNELIHALINATDDKIDQVLTTLRLLNDSNRLDTETGE